MDLKKIITTARGDRPADLLLTNARIVDVFTGDIIPGSLAVADGRIAGLGDYAAEEVRDMKGRYVAPGFIDAHVHIESSMSCPSEFARAVVARGTTAVAADPHEIANVMGLEGIHYMLRASEGQPMQIYFTLPSCVPATEMETSGARLSAEDLEPLLAHERVVALAEMMNYPGVIQTDETVMAKIESARRHRKPLDGHAPGLSGKPLNAYMAAGIGSDHECTTVREAREKIGAGMHIMIREGTGARNLDALLPAVDARTSRRMMWCTDDRHPHDLLDQGHIDAIVRSAIRAGLDPVTAIQMATLNPAEYFGLRDAGAIAPGRRADLVVFSDLTDPIIEAVFSSGRLVAQNGEMLTGIEQPATQPVEPAMQVDLDALDFSLPAQGRRVRVMEIIANQLVTRQILLPASMSHNQAVSDPERDLLKIAVVERHRGTGRVGKGFVKGMGLKQGALASSVAHDAHNIIVVGTHDADMKLAVETVVNMGGGLAAVSDHTLRGSLPLPIAGLMSPEPLAAVRTALDHLLKVAAELGSPLQDPFMTLSFLALPVIPELKITDQGLVDVARFQFVPLFAD